MAVEISNKEDLDYVMHKDRKCKEYCHNDSAGKGCNIYGCRDHCFDSET
jgi:hypothetical protein